MDLSGMESRLLTVEQAATYMGNTPNGIRSMIKKGTIPQSCIVKLGRSIRLDKVRLDRLIDARRESAWG